MGGGKAPAVVPATVVTGGSDDEAGTLEPVVPAPATLNVARMPSRIGCSAGPVIWMRSKAVNAWSAGLAATTWNSAVEPAPPHSV